VGLVGVWGGVGVVGGGLVVVLVVGVVVGVVGLGGLAAEGKMTTNPVGV
jgi:hypothetical protein